MGQAFGQERDKNPRTKDYSKFFKKVIVTFFSTNLVNSQVKVEEKHGDSKLSKTYKSTMHGFITGLNQIIMMQDSMYPSLHLIEFLSNRNCSNYPCILMTSTIPDTQNTLKY